MYHERRSWSYVKNACATRPPAARPPSRPSTPPLGFVHAAAPYAVARAPVVTDEHALRHRRARRGARPRPRRQRPVLVAALAGRGRSARSPRSHGATARNPASASSGSRWRHVHARVGEAVQAERERARVAAREVGVLDAVGRHAMFGELHDGDSKRRGLGVRRRGGCVTWSPKTNDRTRRSTLQKANRRAVPRSRGSHAQRHLLRGSRIDALPV